jgi:hypothetical protein
MRVQLKSAISRWKIEVSSSERLITLQKIQRKENKKVQREVFFPVLYRAYL